MDRRREGGDSGGDRDIPPTEQDESLDGAEEDSIALTWLGLYVVGDGTIDVTSVYFIFSRCRFFE